MVLRWYDRRERVGYTAVVDGERARCTLVDATDARTRRDMPLSGYSRTYNPRQPPIWCSLPAPIYGDLFSLVRLICQPGGS